VALTNVAGMEAPLARVLQLAAQARARYALLARASATQLF
jgi:hypothetical protein